MRLDKFIAQQLGVSRAIAGREIRGSRVTVDGDIVKDASFKLQPEHEVEYDGNTLTQQNGPRYFMLNKPQGYVCSTDDPDHPTILYFLDEPVAHKLHAAGRLDIDTTGLVLMTDDGQWSHRITPTEVRLTISEGRYHQVKRMFAAVGNHVVGLHRERIGDILLDDALAPGEYRPLTETEIASVGAPQARSKT